MLQDCSHGRKNLNSFVKFLKLNIFEIILIMLYEISIANYMYLFFTESNLELCFFYINFSFNSRFIFVTGHIFLLPLFEGEKNAHIFASLKKGKLLCPLTLFVLPSFFYSFFPTPF